MMRSTLSRPVGLSNSYLTLEPRGISMMAWKSRGTSLPGETSCQAWSTVTGLASEVIKKHYGPNQRPLTSHRDGNRREFFVGELGTSRATPLLDRWKERRAR